MRNMMLCFALLFVGCGGGSGAPDRAMDGGPPPADAGNVDSGPMDAGPMDAGPVFECSTVGVDPACDDGDACTDDSCEADFSCSHVNPAATCERFDGLPCAADAIRDALALDEVICIPAVSAMGIELCQGQMCGDGTPGCEFTIQSEVTSTDYMGPPSEMLSVVATFDVEGQARVQGQFDLGGGTPIALDCYIEIVVPPTANVTADLALSRPPMCSSDRPVTADVSVDVTGFDLSITPASLGGILGCTAASIALPGLIDIDALVAGAVPDIETTAESALAGLDCGDCDGSCPGGLVCTLGIGPVPPAP